METQNYRRGNIRLDIPFHLLKRTIIRSLEVKFQNKIQTAKSGTESTVKTDTGNINNRKFVSEPLFQTERNAWKEPVINTNGEINSKNTHWLRGLDGKYGRWDEILRDILNGKLKIVRNRKPMTPKVYDTSERDGRHAPMRTNPEDYTTATHRR